MSSTQSSLSIKTIFLAALATTFKLPFKFTSQLKTFTVYSFIHSIFIECLLAPATVVDSRLTEVTLPFLPKKHRFL